MTEDRTKSLMPVLSYVVRTHWWYDETAYWQNADSLYWRNGRGEGCVAYSAIREVQVYKIRYFGSRKTYWRCVLNCGRGRKICLQAAHYSGFRRIEDRSTSYIPFIKKLEKRIAIANPNSVFRHGRHWLAVVDAVFGRVLLLAQRALQFFDSHHSASVSAWLMRRIGPWLKGQRLAQANVAASYPNKSASEINYMLRAMWSNIGRTFAESAHLNQLWDYNSRNGISATILLDDDSRKRFVALCAAKGPALVFGAHLANWELLAWALGSRRGETAIIYRPPKTPSLARALANMRTGSNVTYIPAGADTVFKIKNALRRGAWIGLLIDEHYPRGVDVQFFGRTCQATPILARLARQFECPIYGGRIVRLPKGKFRLDITGPVPTPRDATGKIDVAATTQIMTSIIESWIREHPEQWLWLQRRWR